MNVFGKSKVSVIAICINEKLIGFEEVENKKVEIIFNKIKTVLQDQSHTPKLVVCDTEPTNTGRKSGVIVQLQNLFSNMTFEPCRINILDLILKHQFSA